MDTMKAVRIHAYGGPKVMAYEEAPRPGVGKGEVMIRVHAAGINPVDWKTREGQLEAFLPHTFPLILGWDCSGTVMEGDAGVTTFQPGDAVFAYTDLSRNGCYAEYAVAKAEEIAPKPESLTHVQAAAVPLAALTAWQVLFDAAKLTAGRKVLIHGAAGGVGHYAVQLAKWAGAHVIGTASSRNTQFLKDLGAHEVIDYTTTPFESAVDNVDVVFDTQGGDTRERSWSILKKGGVLVTILPPPPSEEAMALHGVRGAFVFVRPSGRQLGEIRELIDSGHITPHVETVLPLAEAAQAHELIEAGHTRGKIVLKVAS